MLTRRTLLLLLACPVWAQKANTWSRVRYVGGTIPARVNPYDWNTTLTITPVQIDLVFAGRDHQVIRCADVRAIAYGKKAYRRVGDMLALSVVATPLALFGILHKSMDHQISLEFQDKDGKKGAILLEVHKSNYSDLLKVLSLTTGVKVDQTP